MRQSLLPDVFANPAVDIRALTKRFESADALREVTLRIERGSIFGLLGPNGAGKTTMVKMLLGLVRPSSGSARVLGAPLGDRKTRARIGYLPELFRFPEWLTANEVLAFHASLLHRSLSNRTVEIDEVLSLVGLASRSGDRIGTYSKGMQQRLGLAVALLGEPELVILDEPTSALDPIGRVDVREILRTLQARGVTVLLNSHLLTEVEQICDRMAILRNGSVIAQGSADELVTQHGGVRIRVQANTGNLVALLSDFGDVVAEDGGVRIVGVSADRIPDIVAALVAAKERVMHIEALSQSLEDRFMELVREQ